MQFHQCYVKIILTIYGPTLYVYDDDEFLKSIINYTQPHPVKNSGYHLTQRTKQRTKYPNSYTPHSSTPFKIRPILLKELIVICSWKSARTTYHYWTTFVRIFFYLCPNNTADFWFGNNKDRSKFCFRLCFDNFQCARRCLKFRKFLSVSRAVCTADSHIQWHDTE